MQLVKGSGKNRVVVTLPSAAYGKMSQENKVAHEKATEGVKALILRPGTFRGFE